MVAAIELPTQPDYLTWSAIELVRNNIETERLEEVDVDSIILEASIVDESHADDLGRSMAKKRGQITPVALRAREIDGVVVHDVLDGFHRSAGKKRRGEKKIKANVLYGCDDEEMYDLRILAASSVKSVQYPRKAEWIASAFAQTPWAKKGLTVAQAFGIAMNDTSRARAGLLTREETNALKAWVKDKVDRWDTTVATAHHILQIVEDADPDLVRQVRTSGGGKDRTGKITPARLEAVVTAFPGEDYYGVQRGLLRYVTNNRLSAKETVRFVDRVTDEILPGMDEEVVYQAAVATKVATAHSERDDEEHEFVADEEPDEEQLELESLDDLEGSDDDIVVAFEDDRTDGGDERSYEVEQIMLHKATDINAAPETELYSGPQRKSSQNGVFKRGNNRATTKKDTAHRFTTGDTETPKELRERIALLEKALETARETGGVATGDDFWKTAGYLSLTEYTVLELVNGKNTPIEEVAEILKTTTNQVNLLIKSAYAKRSLIGDK